MDTNRTPENPETPQNPGKTAAWRRKPVWVAAAVVALVAGGAGVAYAVDELGDDDDSSWSASDERRADDLDRDDRDDERRADDYRDDDYRSDDDRDSRGSDYRSDDRDDDGQSPATTGDGSRDDDQRERRDVDDVPLTDAEVASATDAALAEAGGGTVTDVDRSDDADHAFEVDVLLEDGDELEVELADDFTVVWTEVDPADRG